jgi:hypothetical protein
LVERAEYFFRHWYRHTMHLRRLCGQPIVLLRGRLGKRRHGKNSLNQDYDAALLDNMP